MLRAWTGPMNPAPMRQNEITNAPQKLLKVEPGLLSQIGEVAVPELCVGEGVGFHRILFGLCHQPARIADLAECLEDREEVDAPVARHRKDAVDNGVEKAGIA